MRNTRRADDYFSPIQEDAATLDRLRWGLGPLAFSTQYQQEPVTAEGIMIRMEWFGTYNETHPRLRFLKVVQAIAA